MNKVLKKRDLQNNISVSLRKRTAKNNNDGMLQLLALKLPCHTIRLKIVKHEKSEAVTQLTRGQKPFENLHRLSSTSVNTN